VADRRTTPAHALGSVGTLEPELAALFKRVIGTLIRLAKR
jgi:hypothetical protein